MRWQKTARLVVAGAAIAFAIGVASTVKQRKAPVAETPVARTDPNATIESAGGLTFRVNRNREEVRIEYDKALSYPDGGSRLLGIKVTTDRSGRTFVITGKEGQVGDRESTIDIVGDVRVTASDGLVVTTERATYHESDGIARAPGVVEFSRGRMNGTGVGFTYDKNQDVLTILSEPLVHVGPDARGAGTMDVTAGALEFRRNEKYIRFDGAVKAVRAKDVVEADTAVAHLSADDEERLEAVELRGNSKVTVSQPAIGGLQGLAGRDIDLKYGPDGVAIQQALINGDAIIRLAGSGKQPGRQIAASSMDVQLAPDGMTPTALTARDNVVLTIPPEQGGVGRTITAQTLNSQGDERRGLTRARFNGDVRFSERGPDVNRAARSAVLDVVAGPGFSSIDQATFTDAVRFVDGPMTATSAVAQYVLSDGTLALSGSAPANPVPHVVNDQIMVDAARIDITLEGPVLKANTSVRSVLQPKDDKAGGKASDAEVRIPSMLKQDQPVNVTGDSLDYEGGTSKATYTGNVQLWQGETVIKAPSLVIDSKNGNLNAAGPVATVTVLMQEGKDGKQERVRTTATAKAFQYEESNRRVTYTGDAHLNGPQGDLTSRRIELYLTPSGDELERTEAYQDVTLRADNQKTTGGRLTYFSEDGRYLVTGTPVVILDECGRETTGRTLTFYKSTDRIVVDGNEQIRTQTRGKSNCPGS